MLVFDRKNVLAINELTFFSIQEIVEKCKKVNGKKLGKDIISVKVEDDKGSSFLFTVFKKSIIKISKIEGEVCDITLQAGENFGYFSNKNLGLEFGYFEEDLENEIKKVSMKQKHNNDLYFQSYISKNGSGLLIEHKEIVDKEAIQDKDTFSAFSGLENLVDVKFDNKNLVLYVINEKLKDVSEEEILEYADDRGLGLSVEDIETDDSPEEAMSNVAEFLGIDTENLEYSYPDSEENEEEFSSEQMALNEDREFFEGHHVFVNDDELDELASFQTLETLYLDLSEVDICINESTFESIKEITDSLFKIVRFVEKNELQKSVDNAER